MEQKAVTVMLLVGVGLTVPLLAPVIDGIRLPGLERGYEPVQPIAFSHRLHAGELGVSCLYCHSGAERSRHAGIPALNVCMNCHKNVTAPFAEVRAEAAAAASDGRKARTIVSPEIAKIFEALSLNQDRERDPSRPTQSIPWIKVHNLPDFAHFDHRPHVTAGVACQKCHGQVETMERVRQEASLTMGWCVECHRTSKVGPTSPWRNIAATASTDCAACHH